MFDPEHEEWPQYVERLDQFFEANDLTGDDKATKRRATFLTVIGPGPYKLLRSLISPAKPTDKTYGELVKKLTEHYSPTPSEVMQRFRFNSRSRRTEESVAAYMADLRRLAEHCNYGDTLDKMLRDRLVWGINDAGIQRKLLQENDPLTLARALTIATGADKNLKEMKAPAQELDSTSSSQASVKVKVEPVQKIHAKRRLSPSKGAQGGVTCRLHADLRIKCVTSARSEDISLGCVGARHHPPRDLSRRDPLRSQFDKLVKRQRTIQMIPCNTFTLWSKNEMLDYPPLRYMLK